MGTSRNANVSGELSKQIDQEIRTIIDRNYKRAEEILLKHASELELMTEALMLYETIDSDQVKNIMEGRPAGEPKDWQEDSKDDKKPKDEEPVKEASSDEDVADDLSGDETVTDGGEPKVH